MGPPQPPPATGDGAGILEIIAELLDAHTAHDEARMRATLRDGFVYDEVGTGRRADGMQDFLEMWAAWRRVFPDVQGTIDKGFASGGEAVAETTWNGTFDGVLVIGDRTIAGTGERLQDFPVAIVCTAEGRKLTSMRLYFDMASLLKQIGVDLPS